MLRRRTVLKTVAGAGLLSASSLGRALGANDRVRVGLIGHGLIGTRHLLDFKAQPDVEIVAVCELSDAPRFSGPRPASGPPAPRTTPLKESGYDQVSDQFEPHVRNFVDCVKSRKAPVSDLASGHRSSVSCHLANISMKLGRLLIWDEQKQDVTGDAEASRLLTKEYRSPWDRELRAVVSGV